MMFWSTRDSINNDTPSVTAIIETVLAVLVYWWVAIRHETYLPLLISAAVAPLVLLRSDQSVRLGVDWFKAWEANVWKDTRLFLQLGSWQRRLLLAVVLANALLTFVTSYLTARHFLAGINGWSPSWQGFAAGSFWLVAAAVAATVATAWVMMVVGVKEVTRLVAAAAAAAAAVGTVTTTIGVMAATAGVVVTVTLVMGALGLKGTGMTLLLVRVIVIPYVLGLALSALVMSLIVRIGATLRHLGPGLHSLPQNFRRLTLCTSPRQEPELVPGLLPGTTDFTFTDVLQRILKETGLQRTAAFLSYGPFLPIWFLPGWLYRVSLKSTAWFWWPLTFLMGDLSRAKDPQEFHRTTIGSLWAKASIALSIITILTFLWSNLVETGVVFKDNPLLIAVGYFLVVDWSLRPWQLFPIALAVLSVAIVFLVDDAAGQYHLAKTEGKDELVARSETKFRAIERITRLRLILFIVFTLLVGAHTLLYFNSTQCWLNVPSNIEGWAEWVYGKRMPRAHCSISSLIGSSSL
jgi:hypothetical protein